MCVTNKKKTVDSIFSDIFKFKIMSKVELTMMMCLLHI